MAASITPSELQNVVDTVALEALTPARAVMLITHAIYHVQQNVRRCAHLENFRSLNEATDILESLRLLLLYTLPRSANG
jgi:hypothetical protein